MMNYREPTLVEVALQDTLSDLESGIELLDLRVLAAAELAVALTHELIELQDRNLGV